ncbi:MAG: signal peptide peptidase SppA [Sedimentisphaerales bacterium]|jgi:protease-4
MDFENIGESSQQQLGGIPSPQPALAAKKGGGWKIFWGIITGLSMLGNVMLFLMLIGVGIVAFAGRGERKFNEEVIQEGPRTAKIAIVSINGTIDEQQAQDVYWQLKEAREDKNVKGVIIRVNSPGGTISGSDQIHNEIIKYRDETNQPAVAFMQGVAASGGYYSSVACNEIIAEPTAITGSIGVIMEYLVLQQLLEDKLGINPIVVKAGAKKDWPNPFKMPTDEQLKYMQERIIGPAYKRFVKVVADGRSKLTEEDVNRLADGSIYWADKALEEKLIDGIGYLADAIDEVKALAGIKKAQVVEYKKTFSLADILGAKTNVALKIDRRTLYEVAVPQALYLWTGPQ